MHAWGSEPDFCIRMTQRKGATNKASLEKGFNSEIPLEGSFGSFGLLQEPSMKRVVERCRLAAGLENDEPARQKP